MKWFEIDAEVYRESIPSYEEVHFSINTENMTMALIKFGMLVEHNYGPVSLNDIASVELREVKDEQK